jgi:STE24 endopeptidase
VSYALRTEHESAVNEDKATRYHRRRRRADVSGAVLAGGFLLVTSASGVALTLRSAAEWLTAWLPPVLHSGASSALFLVGLAATVQVLELPFGWYRNFWLERRYGLSSQTLVHWLADHVKAATASSAALASVVWAVYFSLRHWPDTWWYASAGACAFAMVLLARLAPILLLPLFYRVRRLRRDALSERLVRLAARAGAPVIGVYEWAISGHTRKANAALVGVGHARRILLSDTLLEACSDDEMEVVVAHELSHQVHHDLWVGMLFQAATLFGGFYVAARLLAAVTPWLGLRDQSDVAGAPVLLLVAGVWSFLMLPLGNALSRAQERRADHYALRLTANPAAFVTAVKRLGQQNMAEDRPSALARWLFYSHPPLRERIAAAEAWSVAPPLPAQGILIGEE